MAWPAANLQIADSEKRGSDISFKSAPCNLTFPLVLLAGLPTIAATKGLLTNYKACFVREFYLVVRDGQLRGDIDEGGCNQAALVGFNDGVAWNDSVGILDINQDIDLSQAGLDLDDLPHVHPSDLQPSPIISVC